MRFLRRVRLGLVAALALPSIAAAQLPASTGLAPVGSLDPWYQSSTNGGGFGPSYVQNRTAGSTYFIWVTAGNSIPGGSADGYVTRFSYAFRTMFDGSAVAGFTFQCAIDDVFSSILLNGSVLAGASCGQYGFGPAVTLGSLPSGTNTLQFNLAGNGVTDGLAVSVTNVIEAPPTNTVPEPTAALLLGTGLVAIAGRGGRALRGRGR